MTTSGRSAATRVGIVAKARLHEAADQLDAIGAWLRERGVAPVFDEDTAALCTPTADCRIHTKEELPRHTDLILVLGGDGTLLGMADRIAEAGVAVPILGVNYGSLGFLTEVTLPELYPALEAAVNGSASIEERLMLRASTTRGGRMFVERLVLNDVVITRGSLSRIIDLAVTVDDEFVTHVRADGLIVATPTGSTAYNLATGGPILHPALDAVVITPIAPHTLSHRPIVLAGEARIRIEPRLDVAPSEIFATFDGQFGFPLERGDQVTVTRTGQPLRLVKATSRSYFELLREKLRWGAR